MKAEEVVAEQGASGKLDLITVPGWTGLPWLVHGFSTRAGGVTTTYQPGSAQHGELNLGYTADDSRDAVTRNRELLLTHVLGGGDTGQQGTAALVTLRQTHSAIVHRVDQPHTPTRSLMEGDGMVTNVPGLLLGILTADCVPVLVVDPEHRAVAACHAGWRGTLEQIVEKGVGRLQEEFGSKPEKLLAAVGPAIGACCYTVGEEVRQMFVDQLPYAGELFSRPATIHSQPGARIDTSSTMRFDLAEANRRQLLSAGLGPDVITMTGVCTSCETNRFFSHRAEHGRTGRMMAVVGIRAA